MLSTDLRTFQPGELSRHPWQDNVPDISGAKWAEFLEDVRRRGIQEPIRVSTRLNYPVIVDGHQRHRAALELGLTELPAFVQPFEDEAQEVDFLASAARMRRHLTDAEKVKIATAYEAYFKPMAAERKGGRPKAGEKNLGSNEPRLSADQRKTTAQAAAAVGLSDATYKRGKTVQEQAPAPVRQAWEREEISTNAAHELTKAPDPIGVAIEAGQIDVHQGLRVLRDKQLKKDVETGVKTVTEAVSLADMLKAQREQREAEMGEKEAHEMQRVLQKIMDISLEDYLFVLNSRHNSEVWGGSFSSDWQEAVRHMRALAQAGDSRSRTIDSRTLDALN